MKGNLIVAQSGGPTAAINASLAGIISEAKKHYSKIYGAINGIQGVLRKKLLDLTDMDAEALDALARTPAMYLGSCRFRLPAVGPEHDKLYEDVFSVFHEYGTEAFCYIGGNDSMDTVDKLATHARRVKSDVCVVGCPKTIDNHLMSIDHTPGFGSAAKYIAGAMREIAYDTYIYDVESVTIVEIMGRDAGWLTTAAALARTEESKAPHLQVK